MLSSMLERVDRVKTEPITRAAAKSEVVKQLLKAALKHMLINREQLVVLNFAAA
jgi:hypothetical protein